MHSVEKEFESRYFLDKEKYFEIASDIFRHHPDMKMISQKNQYFDTDDLLLRENHITIRIRVIPHRAAVLTLKTRNEDGKGDIEISQTLSYFQHHALLHNSHFPKGIVALKLKSLGFALTDIKYQCTLHTKRMQIDKENYNFCIDENHYNDITDYNIEVEADTLENAEKIMKELSKRYSFKIDKKCPGKSTRALLSRKKDL